MVELPLLQKTSRLVLFSFLFYGYKKLPQLLLLPLDYKVWHFDVRGRLELILKTDYALMLVEYVEYG